MAKIKIMDLLPENLREDFINEVQEILKEREQQSQEKKDNIKATPEEIAQVLDHLM